tara:strand:+ start:504 stop:1097 length:594 start_codon:yes stop_codon:yes gene_type:complete
VFKFLVPILIAISFPLEVLSGQFGLEVGESIESIKNKGVKLQKAENYWYYTRNLPTGNSKLKTYALLVTPKSGLCKIIANTKPTYSNMFGDQLIKEFEFFETALGKKYGKSKEVNYLKSGSIWNRGKDWMMGIKRKERYLRAIWSREYGSNLPSYIYGILLDTEVRKLDEGLISIHYEFTNKDKCIEEQDAANTDNL